MNRCKHRRILRVATLAVMALGPAACLDYTFETTIHPDGTGTRVERMEVTREGDLDLTPAELRALTLVAPERGWTTSTRLDEDGDTVWVVERTMPIRTLGGWSDVGRRLILGAMPSQADQRVGYVRLGDVAFRNSVQTGVSRRSDGTSLISYRESFTWDHAADAVIEFMLRDLDRRLKARYPGLTDFERGAVVGYARARVWQAGDEGLFAGENEDEALDRAVERTAAHAVKVIGVRHPDARVEDVREMLSDVLELADEQTNRLFEETLPGLNLGFNTNVVVRVTLPGQITTTNATRRDGNTLEWEFSPLDEFTPTVEIFAESVIGG